MKNQTVLIILGVFIALGAFIFLVERDSITTGERKERDDRLFQTYQRDEVTRLSVQRATGETVVLEKAKAEAGDEGSWRIVEPSPRAAEDSEVRAMLSSIDFVLAGRAVDRTDAEDKEGFGLEKPRLAVSFDIRGARTSFRIGAQAPGERVYLSIDGDGAVVHAVPEDIFESLDKGVAQLRSKRLSPERLGEAVAIAVRGPSGDTSVSRPAALESWNLDTKVGKVLASANAAGELLTQLDGLRAESFIADEVTPDKLGDYGLASPLATATVSLPGGKTQKILVGPTCGEGSHNVQVSFEGSGTVACVDEQVHRLLSRPMEALFERRPVVVRSDEVRKITLRSGKEELVLEKKNEAWIAPAHKEQGLEQGSVDALLASLGQPGAEAPRLEKPAQVAQGSTIVELELAEGDPRLSLTLFRDENGKTWARRGEEPALLPVAKELFDQARADVLAFRERTMKLADKDQLQSIATEGPVAQTAVQKDGKWSLSAPITAAADSAAARQLGEQLAQIAVVRYAAATAAPIHGLTKPHSILRGTFETSEQGKPKTVELRLGALLPEKTDERFAQQAGDPLVFVVGRPYLEASERLLLARDVLTVDETAIKRLTIDVSGKARVLRLEGATWLASDDFKVDEQRLRRLLTDFGTVKTVRTAAFGPKDKLFGRVVATVALFADEMEKPVKVLTIGGKTADSGEDGHFARVEGLDATVVMPRRIVDEILSLGSPPSS